MYDVSKLAMQIFPLSNQAFLLQIENYVITMYITFDKSSQSYKLNTLKNSNDELYFRRFSKFAKNFEFLQMKNGNILLKTSHNIKVLNNTLQLAYRDSYIPMTLNYELLR